MEATKTQQAWTLTTDGEANFYGIATKENWLMRIQQNGEISLDQQKSNIHLVAAAPDLLEACKLLQAALTKYHLRDVKKRFSLCVADAAACKAVHKATN